MGRICKICSGLGLVIATLISGSLYAAEPATCKPIKFGVMPWTDLIATTTATSIVLKKLGYAPEQVNAAESMVATALKTGHIDVFLDYWKPSAEPMLQPLIDSAAIRSAPAPSLSDAQEMLAVPKYMAEKGLRTVSDLPRFKDQLDGRIFGIDAGTEIDKKIANMIQDKRFGLSGFTLIESSEAGMLAQVSKTVAQKKGIVFLAWKPHPMNLNFDLWYLTGSEGALGPNDGAETVWTLTRHTYPEDCPNASRFFDNVRFTSAQETEMMAKILDQHMAPETVAQEFVDAHPKVIRGWIAGVSAFDGGSAEKAVFGKP